MVIKGKTEVGGAAVRGAEIRGENWRRFLACELQLGSKQLAVSVSAPRPASLAVRLPFFSPASFTSLSHQRWVLVHCKCV